MLVLLVLPASGGASSGLFRESGGSRSMGTPVWVPFCWMGAAAIMFAAARRRIVSSLLWWGGREGRGEEEEEEKEGGGGGGGGEGARPVLLSFSKM